jgi:hypothetical protein
VDGGANLRRGRNGVLDSFLVVDESVEDELSGLGEGSGVIDGEESNGNSSSVEFFGVDGEAIGGSLALALGGVEEGEV